MPRFLWISEGGRTVCEDHGGMYLQRAIELRPNAKSHKTPLDHWARVVEGQIDGGWVWRCEECEAHSKKVA